jgi:hypothetical protein
MFPCPSCGFLVFDEPMGSYDICEICDWEDDHVQLKHPLLRGCANRECLLESQEKILIEIPFDIKEYKGYVRDIEWRPLLPKDYNNDKKLPKGGLDYFNTATEEDEDKYYWRK